MKISISDKSGIIRIGNLDVFWINQHYTQRGYCGLELYPLDDLDGYILLMIGSRWRRALTWDFYAFGRYWSHYDEF